MAEVLSDTTDLLRRTPELLRALLLGLPERWADTPDTPDGWRRTTATAGCTYVMTVARTGPTSSIRAPNSEGVDGWER